MADFASFKLKDIMVTIQRLLLTIANPPWVDKSANQIRAQVTGTISTVTTVTTVTGVTNIDSYQGKLPVINNNTTAWALNVRARIS